jgi:hypothetical protein
MPQYITVSFQQVQGPSSHVCYFLNELIFINIRPDVVQFTADVEEHMPIRSLSASASALKETKFDFIVCAPLGLLEATNVTPPALILCNAIWT